MTLPSSLSAAKRCHGQQTLLNDMAAPRSSCFCSVSLCSCHHCLPVLTTMQHCMWPLCQCRKGMHIMVPPLAFSAKAYVVYTLDDTCTAVPPRSW